MISGIRTPPPISTSSPRETTTPAASGQADGERERGRVVVRDERVLGAGQRDEVLLGGASARRRAGRSRGRARGAGSRRRRPRRPRSRVGGHGARPRFVWTMTPVALITGSGRAACEVASSARPATASASAVERPARLARAESRPLLVDDARGRRRSGAGPSARRRPSRRGRSRRGRARRSAGAAWTTGFDDIGSSVAGAHGSRTHRAAPSAAPLVLKTRGPTGTQPLPARW